MGVTSLPELQPILRVAVSGDPPTRPLPTGTIDLHLQPEAWVPGTFPISLSLHWLSREMFLTIAGGIILVELHEVGAGTGDRPVVVDKAKVGAGAPAPIGLTGVGSWGVRGGVKQEHP